MVYNKRGDYKFPGGGAHKNESNEDTLIREVREETGYIVNKVKDKLGIIIERKVDTYKENSIFEMISHYYICEISDNKTVQQLDDYENALDFKPVWIKIDKAININEKILKSNSQEKNPWVYRETYALKQIKKYYNNL